MVSVDLRGKCLVALLALALTACGAADQDAAEPEGAPVAVDTTGVAAAVAAAALPAPPPAASACQPSLDVSDANLVVPAGGCLRSPSGEVLLHVTPNGLVELVRVDAAGNTLLWRASDVAGANHRLTLQTDGNLVIYTAEDAVVWASYSQGAFGRFRLQVGDDGKLAIVELGADGAVGNTRWSAH